MPRREDSLDAFWIDPRLPTSDSPSDSEEASAKMMPCEAVLIIRDKIGFRYERRARLQDFVSEREAAKLLGLPVMTVHRWVKGGQLHGETKRDYSVIRLSEVLRVANERGLLDPERVRTRMRTGSPTDPDFSGFFSDLSTSENMYVRFRRLDQERSRGRGRDASR